MATPRPFTGPNAIGQQLQQAFQLNAQGRSADAERMAKQILKVVPKEPNALYLLGIIAHQAGDTKSAAKHFEKSYKADRNSVAALSGLGIVRLDQKRHAEARELFRKALRLQRNDAVLLNNLGLAYKGEGDYRRAAESFSAALAAQPSYATAALNLGQVANAMGSYGEAEKALRHGLRYEPDSSELLSVLASVFTKRNQFDDAITCLEKAHKTESGRQDPEIACNLAGAYTAKNRFTEAEEILRAALKVEPDHLKASIDLAEILQAGKTDNARAEAKKIFNHAVGIIKKNRSAFLNDTPSTKHRIAKVLEATGHYKQSFVFQKQAQSDWKAALQENGRIYSRPYLEDVVDKTVAAFVDVPCPGPNDAGGNPTARPVFIVGMPRSGTSLTEQILASHPDIAGGGELHFIPEIAMSLVNAGSSYWTDRVPEFEKRFTAPLANRYLEQINEIDATSRYFVDKLPPNFWYVGLIRSMFPNATIFHTVRNPMDVGLSIFTQRFGQDLIYDHDLRDIGHYYRQYRRMMDFWESWDSRIHRIVYEDMVADQQNVSRTLLDILGLGWNDGVMNFHETERDVMTASKLQVRQPIYRTSVEKWRRYEEELEPLRDELGEIADYASYLGREQTK